MFRRKPIYVYIGFILWSVVSTLFLWDSTAQGATVIVTLDEVNVGQCGETWTESGVILSFVETTEEDAGPGYCYFGLEPEYGWVWLYPARLNVDLSEIVNLTGSPVQVEIDVYDGCPHADCTRAFLYDDGSVVDSVYACSNPDNEYTLQLTGGPGTDQLAISSNEAAILEIRLTSTSGPWGASSILGAENPSTSNVLNCLIVLLIPIGSVLLSKRMSRGR